MSGFDIDQAIKDTQYSSQELHIRYKHGNVTNDVFERERETRFDLSEL